MEIVYSKTVKDKDPISGISVRERSLYLVETDVCDLPLPILEEKHVYNYNIGLNPIRNTEWIYSIYEWWITLNEKTDITTIINSYINNENIGDAFWQHP